MPNSIGVEAPDSLSVWQRLSLCPGLRAGEGAGEPRSRPAPVGSGCSQDRWFLRGIAVEQAVAGGRLGTGPSKTGKQ